ncbi:Clp protease N-terminal domain-containing protein [Amycolatopsis anabasis]|uniref:Clp protease N-terminal domain-containing protein n=1 Tax=Amycolatopsis anabasis TaxID=1840409 RepID=UPI00131B5E1E|nr:Clp protease N-terminal domain-containing protein [Amycolatopsis anabasis]
MFERFTGDARLTVVEAQGEAREARSREIDALHLLTALTRFPDSDACRLLGDLGVALDDLVAQAARVRRRGGLSEADAVALDGFGIDVDRIVERIEEAHGPNALAEAGRRGGWGRRSSPGHIPFAGEAKKVLEQSLKEATKIGDRHIGTEHLLLALTTRRGAAADVLAGFDVDQVAVRRALTRRQAS